MVNCLQGSATPVVDAHHHLWRYTAKEFNWIDDRMAALRRNFTVADLNQAIQPASVDFTVAVQARQSLEETRNLLFQAARNPQIGGVVGWLPLASDADLDAALTEFSETPLLVGARHVVQTEPPGFLDGIAFQRGVATLAELNLTFDLLLRADQLPEAAGFVDRHPKQRFVLDHLAKPQIAAGILEPWRQQLYELARRENVFCKISGMVTEDVWETWTIGSLRPYLDAAVDAFGSNRLMAGSDWPVCLVATSYTRWWDTLREYFSAFSSSEHEAVFGGTAIQFYNLTLSSPPEGHNGVPVEI